jgi:hypothetical protein
MRDIREDLVERLRSLEKEREAIKARVKAELHQLDLYEEQLKGLLALEVARAEASDLAETAEESAERSEEVHAEFEADLLKILNDGKDHQHTSIRKAMEELGWHAKDGGKLGRQIHGVLLTLKNRKVVDYLGGSTWRKIRIRAIAAE